MKKITLIILALSLTPTFLFSQCFVKVGGGQANTIGQKSDGTLWGWGWGAWGQAGTGNDQDHSSPVAYANSNQAWIFYEAGYDTTFTIATNGSLWGTGGNDLGQLGVGTTQAVYYSINNINPGTTWKDVSSKSHSYGIQMNGTLWGWGQNDSSQMGNAICCNNQLMPIQIGNDNSWKQVQASGTRSGLAIKENGTLWGWGGNSARLVGPTSTQVVTYPTQIGTATDWNYIIVGAAHGMGLKTNGTLWTWGSNGHGVNGNGNVFNIPQQVGTDNWQAIAAGFHHALGVKSDGTLWAWGRNQLGQLGDGTDISRSAPVQIGTDTNWVSVGAGSFHSFGVKSDGSLWAWGRNIYGGFGNGTTEPSSVPVLIPVSGCSLSVSDYQQVPLVISPNPAQDKVTLNLQSTLQNVVIQLYDLHGRMVLSPVASQGLHQIDFDISQLASGIYIVRVQQDEKIISEQKLVKK